MKKPFRHFVPQMLYNTPVAAMRKLFTPMAKGRDDRTSSAFFQNAPLNQYASSRLRSASGITYPQAAARIDHLQLREPQVDNVTPPDRPTSRRDEASKRPTATK